MPKEAVAKIQSTRPTLYHKELIHEKIEELRKLGFSDPIKMIVSLPAILSYSIENIKVKIEELRKLGFSDPIKMIVSSPAILSYSIEENIKVKIGFVSKIYALYQISLNPCEIFMLIPSLLGIKKDRFWILARALREYQVKRETITSKIVANILFKNTEEILIAIAKNKSNDVNDILKHHPKVKRDIGASGMTKQEYLHHYYKNDSENKVYKRYLRAYPKKKA